MEIKRVLERKDGIKVVVIPKNSPIKKGDYVQIIKVEEKNANNTNDENGEERKIFNRRSSNPDRFFHSGWGRRQIPGRQDGSAENIKLFR